MRLRFIAFLFWLQELCESLLERYDKCSYKGCNNRADSWCITGGHRHCYEHESGFYKDVEMCLTCREGMSEEEIATILAEAAADEKEFEETEETFLP